MRAALASSESSVFTAGRKLGQARIDIEQRTQTRFGVLHRNQEARRAVRDLPLRCWQCCSTRSLWLPGCPACSVLKPLARTERLGWIA